MGGRGAVSGQKSDPIFFVGTPENTQRAEEFQMRLSISLTVVQSIYDIAYIDLEEIVNKGFMAFFGRSLIGEAPQKSLPKSAYLKSGYNCYRYTPLSCGLRGFLVQISDNKFQVNVPFSA